MKVVGILVDSLRGVNFGFWSHLGCSGQNVIIFSCEVSFRLARKKIESSSPQVSQTIKIEVFETQRGKIHFMFLLVSYRHFLMS